MPRLGNGQEVLKVLSSLTRYIPAVSTPVDVVTSAAIAAASQAITFAATPTGIAIGDPIGIIGDGGYEMNACATTPSSGTLATKYKAAFGQSIGAEVVRLQAANLGHIGSGGLTFGGNLPLNPVNAATSKAPIAYTSGAGELTANCTLLGFNFENLAMFFGMDDTAVTGAGTSSDPYQLAVSGLTMGNHGLLFFRALGVKENLKNVMMDFCGCTIQVSGNVTWGGQNAVAELALAFKYQSLVGREF